MDLIRPYAGQFYVALTVLLTVYGQIVLKWQLSQAGAPPGGLVSKFLFLFGMLFNPWVASGFFAAFLAGLCWMAALTKFPLSVAYPFMSLAFVGVILLSAVLFTEPLSSAKVIGMGLLVAGLVVISQKW